MVIDREKIQEVEDYFSEELIELNKQMKDANYIYEILKEEAINLKEAKQRGTFKFTVDTFANLNTVASQKQSILKDQFTIRKTIVDLVSKDKNTEGSKGDFKELLLEIMNENRNKSKKRDKKMNTLKDKVEEMTKE